MTDSRWQQTVADFGHRIPAPLILIFALILIQLSSGAAKMIMTPANANALLFLRLVIGGLLMWLVIRPKVMLFNRSQWIDIALLGVTYALINIAAYQAITHLPLALVATIGFLGPLAVSLGAARRALEFVWPALGFAGVFMLAPITGDADISWSSLSYGLGFAAAWGLYILASARAGRSTSGLDGFTVASVIAAVLLAPIGYADVSYFWSTPTLMMMTLLVTLLITVPFGLEYLSLKRIEPRVFGVLLSLEPAIASVIGIILLHEILSLMSWLAIAIVTAAAIGATLSHRASPVAQGSDAT